MKEDSSHKLTVNWKYFSLEQVNSKHDPPWKVWEQPEDYPSRGLMAFMAAEAARRQGEAPFTSFHLALLKAKHEQGRNIADINTLIEVASGAGLEMSRFQKDLSNRSFLTKLAQDHTAAVETFGVFGTPTLVFPGGKAVFLKLASPPPPSESLAVFEEIRHISEKRQYIMEIKRP